MAGGISAGRGDTVVHGVGLNFTPPPPPPPASPTFAHPPAAAAPQANEEAEARNYMLVSLEAELAQNYVQLRAVQLLKSITLG